MAHLYVVHAAALCLLPGPTRRGALASGLSAALGAQLPASAAPRLSGYDPAAAETRAEAGRQYFPPLTNRATYRYALGRGAWALEQLLTFANVSATIRTTVVRLKDGTLWVNSPQWPTGEFCALLDELGPVGHVVLPCNALEHAAPLNVFATKYPSASLWVTPGQYGPFGSCGFDAASARLGYRVDGVLPAGRPAAGALLPSWADEFEMRTLYVSLPENAGPVSEAAFYHRPSRSLVVTDALVYVPDAPPPIFKTYFSATTVDAPDFWPKSVLQAVFLPLRRADADAGASADEAWPGYASIRGRLIRAPILRAFVDARAPAAVGAWLKEVAAMGDYDRVLSAHFASPVAATPAEFSRAFTYLERPSAEPPIACADWALLDGLGLIEDRKLGAPVVFDFKAGCPGA